MLNSGVLGSNLSAKYQLKEDKIPDLLPTEGLEKYHKKNLLTVPGITRLACSSELSNSDCSDEQASSII